MNNIFIKIDNINGESKDAQHTGWIDVISYSWGVQRFSAGKSTPQYRHLTVHAHIDKATPAMILYASNGNKIRKVELSVCKAGGSAIEYYRITLESTFIAEVLMHDDGEMENVEYVFEADKVKIQYWEQSSAGGKAAETRSGWDIKNNISAF